MKSLKNPSTWIAPRALIPRLPDCALRANHGPLPIWQRWLRRHKGTFLHGDFYCGPECLQTALLRQIARLRLASVPPQPSNRIPLGLLMVARGKLTHLEVRAALEAQRRARYGKIGEWFEKLGFATEEDVTAALALQWGCPVASSFDPATVNSPGEIPLPVLEAFQMLPLHYAPSTNTLYLAFGERVDHAALYAIERILECRTLPCVAGRKTVARQLEQMRQQNRPQDVEFSTCDLGEMGRITSSYVTRISPETVRLSRIGRFIWLHLRAKGAPTNLLFRLEPSPAGSTFRR